ncbi:MAG: type II secretion system protein GspD, partial [Bdellovibrionales bacterium]|nr:type II secretion system protein GspD [Bdellovibrionales bacterium]
IIVGKEKLIRKIRKLKTQEDFHLRPEESGGVLLYYVRKKKKKKIANVLNGIATESKKAQQDKGGSSSAPTRGSSTSTADTPDAVFGGDVKVTADKDTNSLVITASKQDYEVVKNILSKIDIARDQVFVKSIIMEMNADKKLNWGVDYYAFDKKSEGIGRFGFRGSSSLEALIDPRSDSGAIFGFGSGDRFDIKIGGQTTTVSSMVGLVKLIQGNTSSNILSTPQIMAMDNEEAVIEVGDEVPVGKKSTSTAAGSDISVEFKEATIKLELTPFISPDTDSVRMKIKQQVKDISERQIQAADLANSAVALSTRSINTTLVVNSGDTAVLGGLMKNKEKETVAKIPILGDIPILGWLFKSRSVDNVKTNLLVFITPKIIRNSEDNGEVLHNKLDERIQFIQRYMSGRDPYGSEIDNLPRNAARVNYKNDSSFDNEPMESVDEIPALEEPSPESTTPSPEEFEPESPADTF